MVRFDRSSERKSRRDSDDSYSKRETKDRRSFKDSSRPRRDSNRSSNRDFNRESNNYGSKNRRDFKMTKVVCSSCGVECEVPFKPTSTKPVYCDDCFARKGKASPSRFNKEDSNKATDKDIELINKKLDKIMKALNIK